MTIVALWLASNALLFAWLAFGRYIGVPRNEFQPDDRRAA